MHPIFSLIQSYLRLTVQLTATRALPSPATNAQSPLRLRFFAALGAWLLGASLLVACGGGSSTPVSTSSCSSATTTTASTAATAGVACGVSYTGSQLLSYNNATSSATNNPVSETLAFCASWSCTATARNLLSNGIPNHGTTGGQFASKISAQNISASFSMNPSLRGSNTQTGARVLFGYALNGIKFDPATAGTCPASATSAANCNYAGGSDPWLMVALAGGTSPWKFDFGVDTSNAHVQPDGAYHYHGVPTELVTKLNSASTTSMTLVGWARDGYPVYSQYGYQTATNSASGVKAMTSSYTAAATANGRPSSSNFPAGHFESDWSYVAGLGDLDECNGRTGVTPQFPNGIYHYYITTTYPFIPRCVKGVN